jgi:hypothetical protein
MALHWVAYLAAKMVAPKAENSVVHSAARTVDQLVEHSVRDSVVKTDACWAASSAVRLAVQMAAE